MGTMNEPSYLISTSDFIMNVEYIGVTSFRATVQLCDLATRLGVNVRTEILGREIIAAPGDNPHKLYDGFKLPGDGPITMGKIERYGDAA
jgi:hypothetical protein